MDGLIIPATVQAARSETTFAAALAYSSLGLSVLPCKGKEPALRYWKHLQTQRANRPEIFKWAEMGLFGNVGIIGGAVSGVVMVDLDGLNAVEAFSLTFPHLLNTFSVTSGSGLGAHLYYAPEVIPPTTRVSGSLYGGIELRAHGAYVVAPPSIHPISGKPYTIARALPIMQVPHLREVVEWIKSLMAQKHGGQLPPAAGKYQPVRKIDAWAAAALERESGAVRAAAAGARNDTLNRAAFKLGQLVQQGRLSRADVEQALMSAAAGLSATDGEQTVIRTINSGLTAGMNKPVWRKQS
jgi:hypothetical protein